MSGAGVGGRRMRVNPSVLSRGSGDEP